MRLVADIGGTNARLALVEAGRDIPQIGVSTRFQNADFDSFAEMVEAFLFSTPEVPTDMVVAMAGPVSGNRGQLTNLNWTIDATELSARFDGCAVSVINDLAALGYSALHLQADQLLPVVDAPVVAAGQRQALVVGIGTGFNVSPVTVAQDRVICSAAEMGHVSLFSALSDQLEAVQPGLSQHFPSMEALFSGRGRRLFLSQVTGRVVERATPYIERQGQAGNAAFDAALDAYAGLIGVLLAELKVAYLPYDGIFLAGGVARSSLTGTRADLCAEAAARPNRFVSIKPPIWLINDDAAALRGCAEFGR